ncbi:MAG: SCO family protein [Gammaproteobacteria bacterium]|jgi:protein SCO1/2
MDCSYNIIKQRPGRRLQPLLFLIALVLGSQFFVSTAYSQDQEQRELERALSYVLLPKPTGLKPFHLNDQNNKSFGLEELKGKWTFMYFGYTSCPDVCPLTTDELNIVAKKLAAEPAYKRDTQFVFISVDPYRDTPDLLKKFTSYFDFDLLGLVAPVKTLNELTDQLGVFHRRLIVKDRETQQQEYAVEHSSDIYLIDPQGRPVAKFTAPHYGKEIAQLYVKIRQMARSKPNSV